MVLDTSFYTLHVRQLKFPPPDIIALPIEEVYVSATGHLCGFFAAVRLTSLELAERFREHLTPLYNERYGPEVRIEVVTCWDRAGREHRGRVERDTYRVEQVLNQQ